MTLNTPVLFLIFNRVDTAIKVFERIREAQPAYLYIAADGPRHNVRSDISECAQIRSSILSMIDWPCQLKTLFRDENLGCGAAPYQAITWFFDQVEEGIILEDDCLPDNSFFFFCQEILTRFREDTRVMHIGGSNFQREGLKGKDSYYFSSYNHVWGWATWKRSWKNYDFLMTDFDEHTFSRKLSLYGLSDKEKDFWISIFKVTYTEKPQDIWDYQWTYTLWNNEGISIIPGVNLVKNIGFNQQATHTKVESEPMAELKLGSITLPLKHPEKIIINRKADRYTFFTYYSHSDNILKKIYNKIGKSF